MLVRRARRRLRRNGACAGRRRNARRRRRTAAGEKAKRCSASEAARALIAPLEEAGGEAGALLVPSTGEGSGVEGQVLHWDGHSGRSEPIEIPKAQRRRLPRAGDRRELAGERLAARAASSKSGYPAGRGGAVPARRRKRRELELEAGRAEAGAGDGEAPTADRAGAGRRRRAVHGRRHGRAADRQIPAADRDRAKASGSTASATTSAEPEAASTTLFFKPERRRRRQRAGELVPAARRGTPAAPTRCPNAARIAAGGYSRSIAWADPAGGPFGERVITGLREGVSLRLEGDTFTRVLALGAGTNRRGRPRRRARRRVLHAARGLAGRRPAARAPDRRTRGQQADALAGAVPPAAARDRARSRARRSARSPAKRSRSATTARSRATSRARAGCRKACSAPASASKSRGCAPSRGRRPRAPTPSATTGEMWLWRAELGLWEKDPATPLELPRQPARRRLRPRTTRRSATRSEPTKWASAACCCATARPGRRKPRCPPQVAGRELHLGRVRRLGGDRRLPPPAQPSTESFVGGLLVNEGSGWHVDEQAAAAIGPEVPHVGRGAARRRRGGPRRRRGEQAPVRARSGGRALAGHARAAARRRQLARAVPRRRARCGRSSPPAGPGT